MGKPLHHQQQRKSHLMDHQLQGMKDSGPSAPPAEDPPLDSPVDELPTDAALEEAGAAVAGQDAVVLAGTRVPTHDAHETHVLHLGPVATCSPTGTGGAVGGAAWGSTGSVSVAGRQGSRDSCVCPTVASQFQGPRATRVVVRVVLGVQVQRVVVGVPRGHQVAGGKSRRVGGAGRGREARGGGAALVWKDV